MPCIQLQSSDGEIFNVEFEIAMCSFTIKTMMVDLDLEDNCEEVVPLTNVDSNILRKILQWANYHKDDPEANPEDGKPVDRRTDNICEWDQEFMKVDQQTLYGLIKAANYLDIRGLMALTCKTVANMMKGKTEEQMRKMFNIQNDLTPEEEQQIRQENEWCEEVEIVAD
ncbi:S-phase kinase-associated protein 1-like [Aedes albopictus]|uniref:S-phase kinase-associated protein 1 n=1 Tax=Aedes albopictus TaxID=7160 RepID=A0ABM1Y9C6_AEDAL